MKQITFLISLSALIACINAHGYLINPPNRGSAWREDPIKFPAYYQDNSLYCGDGPTMMNSVNRKSTSNNKKIFEKKMIFKKFSSFKIQIKKKKQRADAGKIIYKINFYRKPDLRNV